MIEIELQRRIPAPRQAVWNLYTDHCSWTEWAGVGRVRLDAEGSPERDGVGCVRVISNGPVSVHEEVVAFEPPKRMAYRVVRGVGMKNHLGEVEFEEDGNATLVRWRCHFDPAIPGLGFLLRAITTRVFRQTLDGLEKQFAR